MESELNSRGQKSPVGVSALATAIATTLTILIIHGGARWATTDVAGTRTTGGVPGGELRLRMSTVVGATPLTRGQPRRGQILTREIMARRAGGRHTTRRTAGSRQAVADITPTSIQAIPSGIVVAPFTIRTVE